MTFQPQQVIIAEHVLGESRALDGSRGRDAMRPITLSAEPLDTYTPAEMASYLAGYKNYGDFRADEASKVIPVDKESDYYRSFGRAQSHQRAEVRTSHEGLVKEVDWSSTLTQYLLQWKAIGSFVNDITVGQQGPNINAYQAAMDRCMAVMLLQREIEVWETLTNASNWNANYVIALTGSTKWNAGASVDILGNLQTVQANSDMRITDWWLNQNVANLMLKSTAIRELMRQWYGDNAPAAVNLGAPGQGSADFFIPTLGTFHVVSGKVLDDSAPDDVMPFILNDSVVATVSPPGVPTHGEATATSYTFRLRSAQGGGGFGTREFRVEQRGPLGGRMIVVYACDKPIFTGPTVGGLITGCIQ